MTTSIAQITDKVLGRQRPLTLAGTQILRYERSITHACARLAIKPINEAHAITDDEGLLWAEFMETSPGKAMLEAIDAYTIFALGKRVRQ